MRAAEAYRSEILPRAEEAYRLYLSRYREMAAAYPQVLVAQRTFFELSTEYLESLDEAWRAALRLQGFLAGDGLDAPAAAGESGEVRTIGRGGER
jgi:cobalt-zinc-cadmium efflux system outer membrane protein